MKQVHPTQIEPPDTNDDWLRLFDKEGVQFAILGLHADGELVQAMRSQSGWAVDFENDEAVIFARAASRGG
jgi:hypothetical protein